MNLDCTFRGLKNERRKRRSTYCYVAGNPDLVCCCALVDCGNYDKPGDHWIGWVDDPLSSLCEAAEMKGARILVTIPKEIVEKIDLIVESINKKKEWYQSPSNRQAVINAFLRYGLKQEGLTFCGAGRYAWIPAEE